MKIAETLGIDWYGIITVVYPCSMSPQNRPCIQSRLRGILLTMRKPIKHKRPSDVNELAHHLVEVSTESSGDAIQPPTTAQISLLMAELGRKGGKKGGKRRLETMSATQRRSAARKAAQARWGKKY